MLLSGTVSAQATVTARLDDMAAVERASALITTDLAQALPRISRTESGTLAPAFYADAVIDPHRPALLFVRGGWDNQIGRASGRERVCQYVSISVVAVSFQKKKSN